MTDLPSAAEGTTTVALCNNNSGKPLLHGGRRRRRRILLCVDVLLEVLAFLHVEAIFAGAGLNTGSSLLSRLIARHHPALRRLFRRGPRAITEAKWEIRAFPAIDGGGGVVWYVRLGNVGNDGNTNWCHQLPLPTVPAIVEILEVLGDFTVKCESPLTDPKPLVAFFSANAHLLTDKTLTFRNFVNGREVVKGTLQLGHLKRTLELEICHYEYHRRLINAKIDFHKMLAAAPFALATQTPELSVRFANYQEARAVDAMLASLLEWWLDGDVGDLKNRTLNIQVNECDQLKAVVCMEACFRQIVKCFLSAKTRTFSAYSIVARIGLANILFEETYWRLREKVNAALRRAGLPAGPKQLLYNVQTGERLVRRLDVDREWVRSTTAHLAVHIDWFYGQEPDCCWTTRRRRQQPPVAALHIDFMPDRVK